MADSGNKPDGELPTPKKLKRDNGNEREEKDDVEGGAEEKEVAQSSSMKRLKNDQGETYFNLGTDKRRCTIRKWKNAILVDIREVSCCSCRI